MKRFNINGQSVLLFEDKLWLPVEPEQTIHSVQEPEPEQKKPATKKKGRGRKASYDVEAIKDSLRSGESAAIIAVRHNVAVPTVYNIKLKMKKGGETLPDKQGRAPERATQSNNARQVNHYQCKKGHYFKSTLHQHEAKCPECGDKVFRKLQSEPDLNGPVKEL